MALYHQLQTAIKFANLVPFMKIHICKFGTIIQSSCLKEFDETLLFKSSQRLNLHVILCMLQVLQIFMIYQITNVFPNITKP